MEYRKTGRCLYHVHRPAVFLRTAAHRQKDKSKGSHIGKIWTTLFCAGNAAQKSVSGRFISGGGFLADFVFICVGYSGDWQLSGDG